MSDLKPEEDVDFATSVAPFLVRETIKKEDGGTAAEDMIVMDDKEHRGPTNVAVRHPPAYTHAEGSFICIRLS